MILGLRNQLDDEDDDTNEQTVNQIQASGDGHQVSGNAGQATASQKKTSLPSSYQPGGGNRAYSGNPGAPASLAPPGSAAVRNEGKTSNYRYVIKIRVTNLDICSQMALAGYVYLKISLH